MSNITSEQKEAFMAFNNLDIHIVSKDIQADIFDISMVDIFNHAFFNRGFVNLPFFALEDVEIKNIFEKIKSDENFSIEEKDKFYEINQISFDSMGLDFTSGGSRFGMF